MLNSDDPASIKGKGADMMLPERGNPFGGETPTEASSTPALEEAPAFTTPVEEAVTIESVPAPVAEEMLPAAEAAPMLAEASAPAPAPEAPSVVAVATPPSGVDQPGVRAGTAGGAELQVSPETVGPQMPTFTPPASLSAESDLVSMFITDDRLMVLWTEIDALEQDVVKTPRISLKMAREMSDRLTTARNLLLNRRDQYEEANRQVVEVKYLLARVRRSGLLQHTYPILVYLAVCLGLIVFFFLFRLDRLGAILHAEGSLTENWAWSILFGGVGGVVGAMYGLWTHVARDQDYDPQFALWYYTNPLMGPVLGGLVYFLLLAGLTVSAGGQALTPAPYTVWVLAFAVGFQQNLAWSLLNTVLKGLIPQSERGAAGAKTPPTPEATPKG